MNVRERTYESDVSINLDVLPPLEVETVMDGDEFVIRQNDGNGEAEHTLPRAYAQRIVAEVFRLTEGRPDELSNDCANVALAAIGCVAIRTARGDYALPQNDPASNANAAG